MPPDKTNLLQAWTSKKDVLHRTPNPPAFQEHEIWWCSLGENVQDEMNGKHSNFERPVIIVKKLSNHLAVVVPCTSKPKSGSWFFPFWHPQGNSVAVLAQIRTVSSHRLLRKKGFVNMHDFRRLKTAIAAFLQ